MWEVTTLVIISMSLVVLSMSLNIFVLVKSDKESEETEEVVLTEADRLKLEGRII